MYLSATRPNGHLRQKAKIGLNAPGGCEALPGLDKLDIAVKPVDCFGAYLTLAVSTQASDKHLVIAVRSLGIYIALYRCGHAIRPEDQRIVGQPAARNPGRKSARQPVESPRRKRMSRLRHDRLHIGTCVAMLQTS